MKTKTMLLLCVLFGLIPLQGIAQQIEIRDSSKNDVSQALRDIPPPAPGRAAGAFRREHIVKRLPPLPVTNAAGVDTSQQQAASSKLPVDSVVTFEGLGDENFAIASDPPDTNGAAGLDQYVQWVNTEFAVFDKSTRQRVYGPQDGSALWKDFGGNCEFFNDGDPIVQYDKVANRWLLTQFAVSGTPFSQCIAVSTTADALGTYARYEFQFDDFNDYPKFGVWPDAYYASFNMFRGNRFIGGKACAFEREKMLAGQPARLQCFALQEGGLLPADLDGSTQPPPGTPNFFVNLGANELRLRRFHVDWTDPSRSTLSAPTSIPVSPFEVACDPCVAQPNVTQTLSTLSDRLMYRLAYRNFGTHEALVTSHTVTAGARTGIRWYELRDPGQNPRLEQQGTFASADAFRWMGSLAMDKMGDILLGYSLSSEAVFPSIRFTGHTPSMGKGIMAIEERLIDGGGAQKSLDRWGDYSSISVDPSDDCTFWFTTQFLKETGSFNWHTAVARIKLIGCS